MAETERFTGFSPETVKFLTALKSHNDREWFGRNKTTYTSYVLEPAQAFVTAMGHRLREIVPDCGPRFSTIFWRYEMTRVDWSYHRPG